MIVRVTELVHKTLKTKMHTPHYLQMGKGNFCREIVWHSI